jgi:hypothetical protein
MSFKLSDIGDLAGDFIKDFGLPGIAVGVGVIVLAPILGPALAKAGKPVAKALIKGSIGAYEKGKGALAETREVLEDLIAESRAEMAEAQENKILEPISTDVLPEPQSG